MIRLIFALMLLAAPALAAGKQQAAAGAAKVPTIAVMTLENASGKADDEWMGIGFAETITAKLARLKNVRVVERRQIEKAAKEIALSQSGAVDPRSVVNAGKLLAANYLLIGSVQKLEAGSKSQLMVNTRVMNTESGELFQTVTERGLYDGIFDLQDKLALEVAAALAVPVSLDEKQAVRRDETDSRGAYEFFWMGMAATDICYKEQMYRKALELDPRYVNALTNLASVLMVENIGQPQPDFAEAKQLAQKAITLDSLNAEPHWIMGSIYRREGDKQLAIRELETHLKLDPGSQYKDLVQRQLEKLKK